MSKTIDLAPEDSILKVDQNDDAKESQISISKMMEPSHQFDSIHSRNAKDEIIEEQISQSIAKMVDNTLISYRKSTYRKGNLLLMQNQLLERCDELVR